MPVFYQYPIPDGIFDAVAQEKNCSYRLEKKGSVKH
jgi:hypothetical protein